MKLATLFRRKRGLLFKIVIAIPLLWFSSIGFIVVMSDNNKSDQSEHMIREPRDEPNALRSTNKGSVGHQAALYKPVHPEQPVLEQPNNDRLRLLQRMKEDAAQELRRKEDLQRKKKGEEVLRFEEPMNPFGDFAKNVAGGKSVREPAAPVRKEDPNSPGELGKAVDIKKEQLSPEQKRKFDEGWQKNAFNQYASDMISLHRSLPDVRDAECKSLTYNRDLPDTSVVVIFHNEAWTVLLRTVFSVIDRSPPSLLKEVILVDDCSDMEHLQKQLQDFADTTPKVKLVRAKKREGLIRARLLGASVAMGKVITFLDSHCEATEGWLEPMLERIAIDETNVVCPVIDVIDDTSLRYVHHQGAGTIQIGGFDWNLQYNWHPVPEREKKRRTSPVDAIRSPTMAGGLFSISKAYFEKLGTYDPGMDIWGGENLELSFRVWMCGGTLEIVPCSHVGHIFRKRSPYSWKTGVNVVKKNSVRLAEVWMDEYKTYYYERFNFDLGEYGDVSGRKALRKNLNCKTFDWYIKNIYPELFIPGEAVSSGEIRSKAMSKCLDSSVDHHSYNKPVKTWPCHNQGGNQYWMLSQAGEIRRDEGCMDYAGQFVMIYPCHGMKGNQEWVYGIDNTLRHKNTNLCIELSEDGSKVEMRPCTGIDRQIWTWPRKDKSLVNMVKTRSVR